MFTNNHHQRVAALVQCCPSFFVLAYLDCLHIEKKKKITLKFSDLVVLPYVWSAEIFVMCCAAVWQAKLLWKVFQMRAHFGIRVSAVQPETLWASVPVSDATLSFNGCFHASLLFYFQPRLLDLQSLTHSFSFIRSLGSSLSFPTSLMLTRSFSNYISTCLCNCGSTCLFSLWPCLPLNFKMCLGQSDHMFNLHLFMYMHLQGTQQTTSVYISCCVTSATIGHTFGSSGVQGPPAPSLPLDQGQAVWQVVLVIRSHEGSFLLVFHAVHL